MNKRCFVKRLVSCIVAATVMVGGLQISGVINASAAEPYTEVEWIYLDQQKLRNNDNEKFDTGVSIDGSVNELDWELVAADFEKNSTGANSSLVGLYVASTNARSGYFFSEGRESGLKFYFALGSSHSTNTFVELDEEKCTLVGGFNKPDGTYYYGKKGDPIVINTGWPSSNTGYTNDNKPLPTGNIKVISAYGDNEYMSMRFYSLKIWKDGTLVADLIPAKDSNGKAGIYNKLAGGFIGRTGNYECGPEVNKPANNDDDDDDEHEHNYEWQIVNSATKEHDGEEAEVCTICGARRNTQPVSAFGYALYSYALPMINSAAKGQTVTFEFGVWNAFPKNLMERIAAKSAEGVNFVFRYEWNHVKYEVTIPAGTQVDLQFDWYGPAKMNELYPNTQIK